MDKAIHLNDHLTLEGKIAAGETAATKFQGDGDASIQAKGLDIDSKTTAASGARTLVENLKVQLAAAEVAKATKETELEKSYNLGVDKANEVYPENSEKLKGLSLTMNTHTTHVPLCEKGVGGSMVQSGHSGKGNFHCHSLKNAKDIRLMETNDVATLDETKYYPANPVSFDSSKGGEVIPKTLGVITWWRFYGHNASGDGVWSDPFGGFPIH